MFNSLSTCMAQMAAIAITSISLLAPLPSEAACNYAQASLNNGWGWDTELSESCPPLVQSNITTQHVTSHCEDHGGYPWGWNAVNLVSCRLDQATLQPYGCIDTDPQGDGWGWDGNTSCIITLEVEKYQCDDSGNYPWGWNPTTNTSCRLDLFNIVQSQTFPVSFINLVNVPLECRKIEKQDAQGRDILSYDENIFYSTTLQLLNETALPTSGTVSVAVTNLEQLYTFNNRSNSGFPDSIFAPARVDVPPWQLLYEFNNDRTPPVNFVRFDQLENGSFNVSRRDGNVSTTSRCVVR